MLPKTSLLICGIIATVAIVFLSGVLADGDDTGVVNVKSKEDYVKLLVISNEEKEKLLSSNTQLEGATVFKTMIQERFQIDILHSTAFIENVGDIPFGFLKPLGMENFTKLLNFIKEAAALFNKKVLDELKDIMSSAKWKEEAFALAKTALIEANLVGDAFAFENFERDVGFKTENLNFIRRIRVNIKEVLKPLRDQVTYLLEEGKYYCVDVSSPDYPQGDETIEVCGTDGCKHLTANDVGNKSGIHKDKLCFKEWRKVDVPIRKNPRSEAEKEECVAPGGNKIEAIGCTLSYAAAAAADVTNLFQVRVCKVLERGKMDEFQNQVLDAFKIPMAKRQTPVHEAICKPCDKNVERNGYCTRLEGRVVVQRR